MCVLVVEDDEVLGSAYARILEHLGRNVSLAQDGEQALQNARNNEYDLVLMDLGLPKKDGLETTRAIRALGLNMPIIAITAGHSTKEECLAAGINDYYIKPMFVYQIAEILERYGLHYKKPPADFRDYDQGRS